MFRWSKPIFSLLCVSPDRTPRPSFLASDTQESCTHRAERNWPSLFVRLRPPLGTGLGRPGPYDRDHRPGSLDRRLELRQAQLVAEQAANLPGLRLGRRREEEIYGTPGNENARDQL